MSNKFYSTTSQVVAVSLRVSQLNRLHRIFEVKLKGQKSGFYVNEMM